MISRNHTVLKLFIFFILPFKLQKIRGFSYAKNPEGRRLKSFLQFFVLLTLFYRIAQPMKHRHQKMIHGMHIPCRHKDTAFPVAVVKTEGNLFPDFCFPVQPPPDVPQRMPVYKARVTIFAAHIVIEAFYRKQQRGKAFVLAAAVTVKHGYNFIFLNRVGIRQQF